MKTTLLPCLFAMVLSPPMARSTEIYIDEFEDGDPGLNTFAGNFIQDGNGNPMIETDSSVFWGVDGGWNWGGSNIQSLDEFAFPAADKKYSIEWTIGPMAVTAAGESWGDIRMQLTLLSKNSGQGSMGSTEFWSLTAGGFGVDIVFKDGQNVYANFVAKNDTSPAASNPFGVALQTGHQIDPTQNNTLRIELTATEASLYVNENLSQTVQLFQWGLGGGPGEELENGFFISTRGARANAGRGTMSVAKVSVDLSDIEVPPPPPDPTLSIQKSVPGLRLIANGGQYARQNIRTTGPDPQYSWVGAASPVTYSITINEYPAEPNFQTQMYLVPGSGLEIWRNSPDWSQPVCAVAFINNNADGSAGMRFAYKNGVADSNGQAGHDYWTNDDGTVVEPGGIGVEGAGKGGTVAFVNSTTVLGTWSVTIESDTNITLTAPDGQTATGSILETTAALFANPLFAYFGTVPNQPANIGTSASFSNISITGGVATPIQESFTGEPDPAVLEESADNPATLFVIVPANNPFWLRWTLPDAGWVLQQNPGLTATPAWQTLASNDAIILRNEKWKLLSTPDLLNPRNNFFRLHKP